MFKTSKNLSIELDEGFFKSKLNQEDYNKWQSSINAFDNIGSVYGFIVFMIMMIFDVSIEWSAVAVLIAYRIGYIISQSADLMSYLVNLQRDVHKVFVIIRKYYLMYFMLIGMYLLTGHDRAVIGYFIAMGIHFTMMGIKNIKDINDRRVKYNLHLGSDEMMAFNLLLVYTKSDQNIEALVKSYKYYLNSQ